MQPGHHLSGHDTMVIQWTTPSEKCESSAGSGSISDSWVYGSRCALCGDLFHPNVLASHLLSKYVKLNELFCSVSLSAQLSAITKLWRASIGTWTLAVIYLCSSSFRNASRPLCYRPQIVFVKFSLSLVL